MTRTLSAFVASCALHSVPTTRQCGRDCIEGLSEAMLGCDRKTAYANCWFWRRRFAATTSRNPPRIRAKAICK